MTLPAAEKDALLTRLVAGETVGLQAEILARYRSEMAPSVPSAGEPRKVGELLAAATDRAEKRQHEDARRRAVAKAEGERKEATARETYLKDLATREADAWKQVDDHIATRKAAEYDLAVKLLVDLRDLARRDGREKDVWARVVAIRLAHAKNPTLIARLDNANLVPI